MTAMNLYTGTGDAGETSLYGGSRVGKDSPRVWAYGTVDEANSILGAIHAALAFDDLKEIVREMQRRMFVVGAQIASDAEGRKKFADGISADDVVRLEATIDRYTEECGRSDGFVVPGETFVSSLFHMARTVVRRAERHLVELARTEDVPPEVLKYLNRLSDALFVLAKMEVFRSFVRRVAERICEMAGGTDAGGKYCVETRPCDAMFRAVERESRRIGVPISFAVADEQGTLLYFKRMAGTILVSVGFAQKKAYTAAVMRKATGELASEVVPGGSLYGLDSIDSRLVVFGGGFPLYANGRLVGAVGVSGGTVAEDEQIAVAALDAFKGYVDYFMNSAQSERGCNLE